MRETLDMLYRLFAPMFVVVLIIGGVGLSSELVKNSKDKQAALTVAYAGGCPASAIPANNEVCKARTITGQIIPNPCAGVTENSGTISGVCVEYQGTGCCMPLDWINERGSVKLQLKDLLGDNFLSDAIKGLVQSITSGGGGGGGYSGGTDNGLQRPSCTSISKSPTLPLNPGEKATIAWVESGGFSQVTTVTPGVGIVRGTSVEVAPAESTTYTVKLRNDAGEAQCPPIRVHVGPKDIPEDPQDVTDSNNDDYTVDVWGGGDTSDDASQSDTNYYDIGIYTSDDSQENDFSNDVIIDDDTDKVITTADNYVTVNLSNSQDIVNIQDQSLDISKDDWYDYGDEQLYIERTNKNIKNNNSGLTDQEIYGIWNRPKNPTTGNIGLIGGYVEGDSTGVDPDSQQTPGIFSRIGSWLKQILCPWCNNSATTSLDKLYTASAINSNNKVIVQNVLSSCTTGSGDTGIFVSDDLIQKDICSPNMTEQECKESWAGKRVSVQWGVPCNNVCTLTTQENILRPRLTQSGSLIGIVTNDTEFTLTCIDKSNKESEYKTRIKVL